MKTISVKTRAEKVKFIAEELLANPYHPEKDNLSDVMADVEQWSDDDIDLFLFQMLDGDISQDEIANERN